MVAIDLPRLAYTIHEVADMVSKNKQFVRHEIRIGKLRAIRLGRSFHIRPEWVDAWLNGDEFSEPPTKADFFNGIHQRIPL